MLTRTLRFSGMLLVAAVSVLTASWAWGIGFYLGESKAELQLKYELEVQEHSFAGTPTGRVTIVFTLADEGRLRPLDEVELVVPSHEKNPDGGHWMDLVVSIDMARTNEGKRVGRVHLLKELAERAELRLNTHTLDGKLAPRTRLHHRIPIAKYLENAPAADAPAAPEQKKP